MIKNLSYYVFIITLILFLSGCISHEEKSYMLVKETQSKDQIIPTTQLVPSIPSISELIDNQDQSILQVRHYNWYNAMRLLVCKMLQTHGVTDTSVLLVDNINNQTNGYINTSEVTEILRNMLVNNSKFTLVSAKQICIIKKQLGLSLQDRLSSRGKAIGIARNIEAKYVLYSRVIGSIDLLLLQMQLILVETGEIIWSETCAIK